MNSGTFRQILLLQVVAGIVWFLCACSGAGTQGSSEASCLWGIVQIGRGMGMGFVWKEQQKAKVEEVGERIQSRAAWHGAEVLI